MSEIEVFRALDGARQPLHSATSSTFFSTAGWTAESPDPEYDYGAILVDGDDFASAGAFSFRALPDDALTAQTANLCGYPEDLDAATRAYYHGRAIEDVSDRLLRYTHDTYGGQSGSPIWIDSGEPIAIGIHVRGGPTFNTGIRINDAVAANLDAWSRLT